MVFNSHIFNMNFQQMIERSNHIMLNIFNLRGYTDVSERKKVKFGSTNFETITAKYYNRINDKKENIICFWIPYSDDFLYDIPHNMIGKVSSIATTMMKDIISNNNFTANDHLIFICDSINSYAIKHLISTHIYFEIKTYNETMKNIYLNISVPYYKIIGFTEHDIPFSKIKTDDAVSKLLDFREGYIILTKNKRSGIIGYRHVVNEHYSK
jgi:hypothetical protein